MQAIINYLTHVIEDGDELNDWLTHMPVEIRPIMQLIGFVIQLVLGN